MAAVPAQLWAFLKTVKGADEKEETFLLKVAAVLMKNDVTSEEDLVGGEQAHVKDGEHLSCLIVCRLIDTLLFLQPIL